MPIPWGPEESDNLAMRRDERESFDSEKQGVTIASRGMCFMLGYAVTFWFSHLWKEPVALHIPRHSNPPSYA